MVEQAPSGPLILNVNDTEAARYVVALILRKSGFHVIEAAAGEAALAMIAEHHPSLVVLDVRLPDIDGLEVCRRIRADPATASTKVLHTSATLVTLDSKVQSLEGGADAYLTQPFEAEELIATVRSLLRLDEAERELRRSADQLRETDRRKDEFLAMLAHELRNPLAAISTTLPILARREPMDAAERRAREVLQRQTRHLGRLVDDLLDVARVTHGKIELNWETIELRALLDRVVASMETTKTKARDQQVCLSMPALPVYVRGDVTRLEQVFTNLLDNASKYMNPGGCIEVELRSTFGDDGAQAASIKVRDQGIGIAADTLPSIFSLFSQADVPVARSRGGLGIGLTLVRTLINLHGGEVTARSGGLGHGSEFEIQLPGLGRDTAAQPHPELRASEHGGTRRRVLVVEDNSDARQALADLLELWGNEVVSASDGLGGVSQATMLRPEIALVDIGLPGIDGFEVARRIRASDEGEGMLLVALTGYGAPEQRTKALEAGFDLHLVKPVDTERLGALLDDPTSALRAEHVRIARPAS